MYGEIELAWRTLPKGAGPILGVTGTNGKSTTTALLGELMRQQGLRTFVGGNLGVPFTLAYEDPATAPYEMHVIELSSFQLEGIVDAQFDGAAHLEPHAGSPRPLPQPRGVRSGQGAHLPEPATRGLRGGERRRLRGVRRSALLAKVPVYGFTRDAQAHQTPASGPSRWAATKSFSFALARAPRTSP